VEGYHVTIKGGEASVRLLAARALRLPNGYSVPLPHKGQDVSGGEYNGLDWMWVRMCMVIMNWIGLDWVSELVDSVGLDLAKWTYVQLCAIHRVRSQC